MKKGKLIKWLLVFVISAVLFIIGSTCAKAAVEEAEPSAAAEPTPDPWSGDFEFPDWMQTEFEFTTPIPSYSPEYSMPRNLEVPDDTVLKPIDSSFTYYTYLNAYQSYISNNDMSVWYNKSFSNVQNAISSNGTTYLFQPWLVGSDYHNYSNNALNFYYNHGLYHLSSNNSKFDASVSHYSFSVQDEYFGDFDDYIPADSISTSNDIIYYFALNKLFPHFSSPPSWFSDAGISESLLLDLKVYCTATIQCVMYSSDYEEDYYEDYSISLDPITLREFYSGVTFNIPLSEIFGDNGMVYMVRFNFFIPFMGSDWPGITRYYDYLAAHPEITGHVPFYIYWDGSNTSTSEGRGALTFGRFYCLSEKQDNRNWLQKLFIPSQSQMTELFQYYSPSVDGDGVFSFAATFRAAMFSWLVDTTQQDFKITLPEMTIPINRTRYTFSNEYEFNLTGTLRDAGILPYIRMATNMMITVLFVNSVITMVFAVFDIHLFDGVKE